MKIPNYIEALIRRRSKLAGDLLDVDFRLSVWLEDKGIELETYDTFGGSEIYVNPDASAQRVREAIRRK